ncbi:hypothetical protein HDU67_001870, partial [Dinochytrium kinnereticum]
MEEGEMTRQPSLPGLMMMMMKEVEVRDSGPFRDVMDLSGDAGAGVALSSDEGMVLDGVGPGFGHTLFDQRVGERPGNAASEPLNIPTPPSMPLSASPMMDSPLSVTSLPPLTTPPPRNSFRVIGGPAQLSTPLPVTLHTPAAPLKVITVSTPFLHHEDKDHDDHDHDHDDDGDDDDATNPTSPTMPPTTRACFDTTPGAGPTYTLLTTFAQRYKLGELLGRGATGFVASALRRVDGVETAVKFILKDRIPPSGWKRDRGLGCVVPVEVFTLRRLEHPNIVRFLEVFEDAT